MRRPEIATTSGSERELAAAAQLERLLDIHDTGRWLFTDLVRIQSMVMARSHPVLRLNTRHLTSDVLALQTYLHEQLHWWLHDLPGAVTALEEVRARGAGCRGGPRRVHDDRQLHLDLPGDPRRPAVVRRPRRTASPRASGFAT